MLQYFDSLYAKKLPVSCTPNYIYDDLQRNLPIQNLNLIFEIDQDSFVKTKLDEVSTDQTKRSTVIMKVAEKKDIELNSKSTGSEMEEEFICRWKNCSMVFYKLDQLAAHVTDTHAVASNQGLYHCKWDGCPRSERGFNARYKMLVHVRTHTKEKPHQCLLCDKSFSRAENLKIHTRSHSGEKPYICPVEGCNKAYSNSSDRFKHTRTHSTEKPYVCKIPGCQKRYTDPSSLRKHVKTYKHSMCMEINFQTDSDKTLQVDNKTNIIQDSLYTPVYNSQCMSSYSANERPDYFINHGPTHNICGSLNGHFRQIFVSYNKPFKSFSPTYWMNEETTPLLIDNMNIDSPLDLTITREKR